MLKIRQVQSTVTLVGELEFTKKENICFLEFHIGIQNWTLTVKEDFFFLFFFWSNRERRLQRINILFPISRGRAWLISEEESPLGWIC